jgi:hypothetical protein
VTKRTQRLIGAVLLAIALALPATPAAADAPRSPWGPLHQIAAQIVRHDAEVVTSDRGISVVTWQSRFSRGHFDVHAAVRSQDGTWSRPRRLSEPDEQAAEPTSVVWGDGNVSVFWEREVSTDDWQFRVRTMGADGRWRPTRSLLTAHYAFPGFQVDVNDAGAVLLSWEHGDHRLRTAVLATDGPWRRLPIIAVKSPGTTFRFISNPQRAFLTDSGDVRVITWGRHRGTRGRALWSALLAADGTWRYAKIAPIRGDQLKYNWVDQVRFATDRNGDLATVWSQQDPQTHSWTTLFRYDPAGPRTGKVRVLGHARCDRDWDWCADVAISDSGAAVVAWASGQTGGQNVMVARRPPHAQLSAAQTLYEETVDFAFSGVAVDANPRGDAIVSFPGGDADRLIQEFARCPAATRCRPLVERRDRPSWLDPLDVSVAPQGGAVVAWVTGCGGGGEACFGTRVWARWLSASG